MTFSTLGTDTTTNQPVYLYQKYRIEGLTVIGLQRMGKSGLFENLIIDDIKQGTGVCVLDPHGELVEHVRARLTSNREKDVIFLDLFDTDNPFGINILECSDPTSDDKITETVNQVTHVFEKSFGVSQESTPRIYDYLFNTAYTLIANPVHTLIDIPLIFNDAFRQKLLSNVPSPEVHKFWDDYKQLSQQKQDEEAREILRRLNDLSHAPLRNIVGQSHSTIDLQKIMDGGKILLVKLDRKRERATSLIGSILVARILNASDTRNPKMPFHLYADEFHNFATEDFAILIEQAGKRNIGVAMAFQNLSQLELSDKQAEKKLKDRTLSVGSLFVFRSPTNTDELAEKFDTSPQPAWEQEIEEESVEVTKEEWFEPITDVIEDGVEEIKSPVSTPFDWLVSGHTHTNPLVNRFADGTLRKIHTVLSSKYDVGKNIQAELNSFLYRAMTSSDPLAFLCEKSSLSFLLQLNDGYPFGVYYFGETVAASLPEVESSLFTSTLTLDTPMNVRLPQNYKPQYVPVRMPLLTTKKDWEEAKRVYSLDVTMISAVTSMIRASGDNQFHLASEQFARLAQVKLKNLIDSYIAEYEKAYEKNGNILPHYYSNPWLTPEQEAAKCQREFQRWMTEERAQFETFIREFRDFVLALAKEPITTSSGLSQPRKRTQIHYLTHPRETITHPRKTIQHPQRTHADMQNDIANQLRGLPRFIARVKLTDASDIVMEYTLQTLKPANGLYGVILQDRLDRIRKYNIIAGYIRDRAKVEAEIALRQAQQPQKTETKPLEMKRKYLVEPQPVQSSAASSSQLEKELMELWQRAIKNGLTTLEFNEWCEQEAQQIEWLKKLKGI